MTFGSQFDMSIRDIAIATVPIPALVSVSVQIPVVQRYF